MFLTKNQVWKGSNQDRAGTQRSVQTLTVHAETGLEKPKYIRIESDEGSKEKKDSLLQAYQMQRKTSENVTHCSMGQRTRRQRMKK